MTTGNIELVLGRINPALSFLGRELTDMMQSLGFKKNVEVTGCKLANFPNRVYTWEIRTMIHAREGATPKGPYLTTDHEDSLEQ